MAPSERRGTTLLEIVIGLAILGLVLAPLMSLFTASRRASYAANRLIEVSMEAQMVLEALAQLEPADINLPPAGDVLVFTDQAPIGVTGSARYQSILDYFNARPRPASLLRKVTAHRLPGTNQLEFQLEATWIAVVGDTTTEQSLTMAMASIPRSWQ